MKLLSTSTFLAACGLASAAVVSSNDKGTQPASKYVKVDFDKLRGDTAEDATAGAVAHGMLAKRADGSETVVIKNQQTFYSVELGVGSPAQNVTLLIDTGSSDMWVMGSNNPFCKGGSGSNSKHVLLGNHAKQLDEEVNRNWASTLKSFLTATVTATATATASADSGDDTPSRTSVDSEFATLTCSKYGTFATDSSSTFKSNNTAFYIEYGDSTYALGTWGRDNVTLQDITLSGISMAVANESNSTFGVLGIGLTDLEVTNVGSLVGSSGEPYTYDNLPAKMVSEGIIHKNAYSLFLDSLDAKKGSVLFGAVDHSKYTGTLYTLPLSNSYRSMGYTDPIQLEITLQGFGMTANNTNTTFTTTPLTALLDSGTTLTYLPSSLVRLVAAKLGARYDSSYGYYFFRCSAVEDSDELVFDFGGFHIASKLSNFIIESSGSVCALGLVPQSSSNVILGDNFLTAAYVVYDLENLEISLAQANYNGGSSDIEVITSTVPNAVKGPRYSSTWSTNAPISTGGNIFTVSASNSTSTARGSASGTTSSSGTSSTSNSDKKNAAVGAATPGAPGLLSVLALLIAAGLA
ncbi:LAQU0S28e00430g1_1 [Lachancea quebecensis]|uniref:LAQU0S28e00430g1_1 n=1 Tax=Lachancea quebecensis TaxID=1654605 RepID=A0A0N7MMH7_9SACH|nr:LAQU0S28e00430g1_1 [Lachancea quebecensis]